ncbi:MAG: FAD:protein FMN transferase [Akkermansiaceae bacterium]|nr:FAD:protein FMN transferase [Akkermansiaceae bacterium]
MTSNLTAGLFKLGFQALGTVCEVQFRTGSVEGAKEFRAAALGWLRHFEERWSRFKSGSLLCQINAQAGLGPVEVTEEEEEVLRLCDHTYRVSRGLNDPTSFPLTRLWNDAGNRGVLPSQGEIDEVKELVSWPLVERGNGEVFLPRKGMALEIGGFGKEYAVDQLIAFAQKFGIEDCLVDLGRDVSALGEPPHGPYWVVGVEDAREEEAAAYRLAFTGKALATSGNGRRFRVIGGKKFGHIIDPRNGWPAENDLLTASCLADDCLTAGILSTNACILGTEEGLAEIERSHGVEAILQSSTQTHYSSNIHRYVLGS